MPTAFLLSSIAALQFIIWRFLVPLPNENFLTGDLFVKEFLKPFESVRHAIGLLMFEFSRFWPTDYEHGRDFVADLDNFLGQLDRGWPFGVEMRNRNWLKPEYFECLSRHQVAHVYNI